MEAQDMLCMVLEAIITLKEKFKADHVVNVLIGKETGQVKENEHEDLEIFGTAPEEDEKTLHAVIRQAMISGYIDKDNELIVGVQTDAPLKRGVNPFGGMRMCISACDAYGHTLSDSVKDKFKYQNTHNDGVFSAYTSEMRAARKCHVLTGLPDAYGRGRIIGDYRRVALYGVDRLIAEKQNNKVALGNSDMNVDSIRATEELHFQIKALNELKAMAASYGYDISQPASNAIEAVQWTYFAYLAVIKEQNGAANSLGRVGTFFDVYFELHLSLLPTPSFCLVLLYHKKRGSPARTFAV
jgi:formate acetyltransferase 1